ncbi:hypothetical protein VF21_03280 [Pseudogymnoascus sp. 05NY08]|nr:hypothetical protein VF21_03280 [Pseudogymnoascus sp. 05NY08]
MAGHRPKRTTASASTLLSSSPRDPNSCPFEDFLQYLDSSLSRNAFLRLSEGTIKKMKATLATLRRTDQKIASDIVERIVSVIDAIQETCSQLHPSAFVAIVRILIHAGSSQFRDRGLYLLAESLHNANKNQEATDDIQKSLSDISKDCLELIFVTFCDKSESYKTRRWVGLLVLELTSHSDDNVGLIGFIPEDKRRKLGSQILYEENEILRTISGRILTTLTSSDIIPKEWLFPAQTEKELIAQYPEQAPSASQWDKRFSSYLDNIWDKIAGTENNGSIDFAQNVVTIPEYLNTRTMSIYHRSIYVVLSDSVYIYIHSEKKGFDTAIDIPFHLISDIRVKPTPLDQSVGTEPPADLILTIKDNGGDQACVNSSPSKLSVVQLTFRDTALATNIGKAVRLCGAKLNSETGGQDTAADNEKMPNHRDHSEPTKKTSFIKASQSIGGFSFDHNHTSKATKRNNSMRVSQSDERLALYENTAVASAKVTKQTSFKELPQSEKRLALDGNDDINTETIEAQDISGIHTNNHDTESPYEESSANLFVGVEIASESSPITVQDKILPTKKSQNTVDNDGSLYDASPVAHGRRPRSSIAAAPTNSIIGPQERVLPIPTTASIAQEQNVVGGVGKTRKSPRLAPTKVNTRTEDNEVSGMTINTSVAFGISSPIHRSPLVAFPNNPADDALLPTQCDGSTDELVKMLPVTTRPKKKPALKSKKPLGLSKKSDEKGNTTSKSTKQEDKATERKYPLAKGDIIEETQDTGDVDIAPEKAPKQHSEKENKIWNIEADSQKLTALPVKKSVETGKGASKKRKAELDVPDRTRRSTRRNVLSVKETANEFADGTDDKSDRDNKLFPTKLAKIEQVDGKEDSVVAAAVVTKPKKGKKKPLLRPKAALKVKESVPNDIDMSHADIGGPHVESDGGPHIESDPLDPLQRHETFFEEAFHDYELPNMDDGPQFIPVPPVSAVTKMASKMADMFGFVGESPELQRKLRVYGKPAQKATRATQKQSKPKAKVSPKGKEREEVDILPEADSLPEQPEQKRSLITTGKAPITTLGKEVETICISSDEESDDSEDDEPCQPQAVTNSAMIKRDEKSTLATAVKTESFMPALLEAPSDLSPKDQSTPAMADLSHPTAVAPTKVRNAVDASHLVDDHLSRKTPIVAFGRNGPKNKGVSSAMKPKPVEQLNSKMDMAKLVNAVAFGPSRKRPSPESIPHVEASLPKRAKKVEVAANKAEDNDVYNDDIPNMLPHRLKSSTPFAPEQDSLLCSSQSRVDENGSPHARPTTIEETAKVAQNRRRTLSIPERMSYISQNNDNVIEKGPFDDLDDGMHLVLDDEPTMVQYIDGPSPNRKPQLLGREKEAIVNPRYLLSRPTTAGKNLEVIPETDHASTINSVNPFEERQPRKLSNFAKRLKGEQPVRSRVTMTTESQPQPVLKAANGQPRKRSFVFEPEVSVPDPEKTLVEAESQYQWRRARSISFGSTVSSSDTVDDKASVAESEEDELTPVMAWRKSLQPPYRDLTNTLICMVHALVKNLVDKETAIDYIVDEFARNGTKLVEELEREAGADRRELESQFLNTLQQVTRGFKQTRDATIALNSEWEDLDDLEAQWRKRQHELQDFMNERIKCAPVAPKKRSSIRAKVSRAGSGMMTRPANYEPSSSFGAGVSDDFLNTKKDKRTIKHSAFVNRIEKANTKTLKRRRPSKKLVATLESLAEALPDFDDDGNGGERIVGDAKIKHRSLKSRPGATKRREKLEKMERERFGKNMAQLSVSTESAPAMEGQPHAAAAAATSNKWAALRGFISQTLEQKAEFVKS